MDVLSNDTELDELREGARATLLAYQVEVALIGSNAKAIEQAAMSTLEAAAGIVQRQSRIAQEIKDQLANIA